MFRISKIQFNDGTPLDVNKGDIIVFVGPNNAGKSQCLKDIYNQMRNGDKGVVIDNITKVKENLDNLHDFLSSISNTKEDNDGRVSYTGFKINANSAYFDGFRSGSSYDRYFIDAFMNILNTEDRLILANPVNVINPEEDPTYPLHILKKNDHDEQLKFSEYFNAAFGYSITPSFDEKDISLYMGDEVDFGDQKFPNENVRRETHKKRLQTYPKVHQQGDGMRSFAGILLTLLISHIETFLIDEPESFLHPPQARIIGRVLAELVSKDKNLFISTHSEDLIKGLLDTCPDRIKIVRITRKEDTNKIHILNNEILNKVWSDSLLKYSDILNSMFHDKSVICESDSDCKMYSIILDYLKQKDGVLHSSLFLHSGGKDRLKLPVETLRALGVDYRVVPDLDILNEEKNVRNLYEAADGTWDEIKDDYEIIVKFVRSKDEKLTLDNINEIVHDFIEEMRKNGQVEFDKNDIEDLKASIKNPSGWKKMKKRGMEFFDTPEAKAAIESLDAKFKSKGIYMVPIGEIENYIPKGKKYHGPKWVNKVLEDHPKLAEDVYNGLKDFVGSWNI